MAAETYERARVPVLAAARSTPTQALVWAVHPSPIPTSMERPTAAAPFPPLPAIPPAAYK